jgi:hypothetical protein
MQFGIPEKSNSGYLSLFNKEFTAQPPSTRDRICCSVEGKIISVRYNLIAFVKHKSMTEFGEGNNVSLPIKIVAMPCVSDCLVNPFEREEVVVP